MCVYVICRYVSACICMCEFMCMCFVCRLCMSLCVCAYVMCVLYLGMWVYAYVCYIKVCEYISVCVLYIDKLCMYVCMCVCVCVCVCVCRSKVLVQLLSWLFCLLIFETGSFIKPRAQLSSPICWLGCQETWGPLVPLLASSTGLQQHLCPSFI